MFRKSKSVHRNNEKVAKPDDTEFDCETHISDRQSKQKHRTKTKKKSGTSKDKTAEPLRSRSCTPLEKLFNKNKKSKPPSPVPSAVVDIAEDNHDDTTSISSSSSVSSDWSTSTYPDSQSSEKSDQLIHRRQSLPATNPPNASYQKKHQSCVESFYLGKEYIRPTLSSPQTKASLPKIKEEYNKMKSSLAQQQQPSSNKRNDMKAVPVKSKQVLQNVQKMIKDQSIQDQHFHDTRQRESVRL